MTTTYCAVAAPIAMIFTVNDSLVRRSLEGLTDKERWTAPTERNNPMLWVAGHVAQTRASMLQLMGGPFDTGWGDVFNRGAALGDSERYPSRDEIERVMRDVTSRLQ